MQKKSRQSVKKFGSSSSSKPFNLKIFVEGFGVGYHEAG
jgi:hypothetical protein